MQRRRQNPEQRTRSRASGLDVVPRQPIAQAVRQTQNPLPHGHVWEDVVHQVRGALGHPSAAATRAKPPSLTREGHQPIQTAGGTAKPGEATG